MECLKRNICEHIFQILKQKSCISETTQTVVKEKGRMYTSIVVTLFITVAVVTRCVSEKWCEAWSDAERSQTARSCDCCDSSRRPLCEFEKAARENSRRTNSSLHSPRFIRSLISFHSSLSPTHPPIPLQCLPAYITVRWGQRKKNSNARTHIHINTRPHRSCKGRAMWSGGEGLRSGRVWNRVKGPVQHTHTQT